MTAKDLRTLSRYLKNLSAEELYQLDYTHMFPLRRLKGSAQQFALTEIIYILEATEPYGKRLSYVARLYCWLMPRSCLGPWRLYRLSVFAVQFKYFSLHRHFAAAMQCPGFEMMFVPAVYPDGRSACIVTTDPMCGLEEHSVLCLYVFNGLPYMALWAGGAVNLERLDSALALVLRRNPQRCLVSANPTLDASLAAARHLLDVESRYPSIEEASDSINLLAQV